MVEQSIKIANRSFKSNPEAMYGMEKTRKVNKKRVGSQKIKINITENFGHLVGILSEQNPALMREKRSPTGN